jgi:hypothetical protein
MKQCLYLVVLLIFCMACTSNTKQTNEHENKNVGSTALILDTFSIFPEEIEGCACYFSQNSRNFDQHLYILAGNYTGILYLCVDHQMIRLQQFGNEISGKDYTIRKYKNKLYECTIEIHQNRRNGDETFLQKGKLDIRNQKGHRLKMTLFGECGC